MKLCPSCGERLSAGVESCPNCGAAVKKPPQKRGRGPVLALAAAVLALAVFAGAKLLPGLLTPPDRAFVACHQALLLPVLARLEEGMDAWNNAQLSTDLTITADVGNLEVQPFLKGSALSLRVEADRRHIVLNGGLDLVGSRILSWDFTYDRQTVGFRLPQADNVYYTLDVLDLFSRMSGMELAPEQLEPPELSGEEWRALAQTYLDLVYTVVNKDNVTVEKRQPVTPRCLMSRDGSFQGTVYTFTPRAGDVEAMLRKLADCMEQDEALRTLITIRTGISDPAELDEEIGQAAQTLRERAAGMGQDVEDSGFTWTLALEGKKIRQISISTREDPDALLYESADHTAAVSLSDGGEEVFFVSVYSTRVKDTLSGTIEFRVKEDAGLAVPFYGVDDKKRSALGLHPGNYEFHPYGTGWGLDKPELLDLTLEVTAGAADSMDHILSIQGDKALFGGLFDRVDITVNATQTGSAAAPDSPPTDISGYTIEELDALFERLADAVQRELYVSLPLLLNHG
ncbi:MAG: zinc ribbon domain-containing protein [Lawsonibacter sp.]|nr:zinc ribbon domain-containing protein [Lawsonibacter sp.]